MKSIFIGTVELSWQCLKVIINYSDVKAIFSYKDDGKKIVSGYKKFDDISKKNNIPIFYTNNINSLENINLIKKINPDIIFCIGWPQLIVKDILDIPIYKSIGIHSSLLPKYRGGAPVNWAIINNEKKWGITLMYLGINADDGNIIDQILFDISFDDYPKNVYDKVTEASINILKKNLPKIINNNIIAKKQNNNLSTTFSKRKPEDGEIDWKKSSLEIYNWIRALGHPYPGSFTYTNDRNKVLIWESEVFDHDSRLNMPGSFIKLIPYKGIVVQCGKGSLLLKKMQFTEDFEMSATVWALNNYENLSDIKFIMINT